MTTATLQQTPVRSRGQHMEALELANRIRLGRAQRKREIKRLPRARSIQLAVGYALDPPAELQTMTAYDLVRSCRQLGRKNADRMMVRCQISEARTLGGLTDRQRHALSAALSAALVATR
jgi:hypothetical protein